MFPDYKPGMPHYVKEWCSPREWVRMMEDYCRLIGELESAQDFYAMGEYNRFYWCLEASNYIQEESQPCPLIR